MQVGIGLPNAVPGTAGEQLVEWARRADQAGFSSLGTIDRIVYPNYEPLVSLAAAAAVTERIRLATTILLGPTRHSAAFLAKQAASVNALAGGRLVLNAFLGDYAGQIAASAAKDADTVKGYMQAFEQAGCDELILFPSSPEPEQVDLLAEAAL